MKIVSAAAVIFFLLFVSNVYSADDYKVVFETIDCSGNIGFTTLGPDEIYKIESGDCNHPDHPNQKLMKMLVHNGQGSYNVFTLSLEEARNVMKDVKEYMKARKEVLENSNSVIISQ